MNLTPVTLYLISMIPKHLLTLSLSLCLFFGLRAQQDVLISYEHIAHLSIDDIQHRYKTLGIPKMITPIQYPIDIFDIIYYTELPDGERIRASGIYFVPQVEEGQALPVVQYNHGTAFKMRGEGSYDYNGEKDVATFYATDGYAIAWQDYIGLGKVNDHFHPYQHAETEGRSGYDLLRALREVNLELDIAWNDQLFVTGYSQGGHAAMAVHKYIQEHPEANLSVTASSPMSGAYDMAGAQSVTMFQEYTQPWYLPYLIYGYESIYDEIEGPTEAVFKPPYDTLIPNMYDGNHDRFDFNKVLPSIPAEMVVDSIVNLFKTDSNFFFTRLLKENALWNWVPESPMQICYCKADEEVFYKNAIVAHEYMKENGAIHNRLRHSGKKFNHFDCAGFSAIYTKFYFDSFRKGSKRGRKGPIMKRFMISMAKLFTKVK